MLKLFIYFLSVIEVNVISQLRTFKHIICVCVCETMQLCDGISHKSEILTSSTYFFMWHG